MSTGATAIVPVKRFGAAKQRLTSALAPGQRATMAAAMLADVLLALGSARSVDRVLVVSGEARAVALAQEAGAGTLDDPGDAGHSEAALLGIATLGADARAILLPGDCPLLDPAELDEAVGRVRASGVGVIPDRHGTGTNGLILSPARAIEPAFGPGSCRRHLALAAIAGHPGLILEVPSLALDLDTGSDLEELTARLGEEPSRAPRTAEALGDLGHLAVEQS